MMRKKEFQCTIVFSCLLSFSNISLYGQVGETMSIYTKDSFSIVASPVIVHATALRLPFTVSHIGQKKIELLSEPTIEPLLNSTAGIWMQTGALNTNRISIRGVGYREPFATTGIKIYLDEIPLTNGVGEASIEDIHPYILSGIDIWRGPASVLWGSGLGGMIHLKSFIPDQDAWQSRIQVGSYDRLRIDQHISTRYGSQKQWGTSLHYQYLGDSGFRDNNDYKKHSFTWMQQYRNEKGWTLNSFIHAIGLKAFIPSSITFTDFNNNPSIAAPTWAAVKGNEDYTKWITGLNALYVSPHQWVYRGSVFGTFFNADEVRPFNVLDENNTSYGTRHRISFPVKQAGHITAGLEYFKERYAFSTFETLEGGVAGQKLTDQKEHRTYINGFIQSEWNVGKKWYLFAGMNLAASQLSNADLKSDVPLDVYPTAGISYAIYSNLSVSASLSRGYSSLSLDDLLNADGTINPDIIPETGWSKEVSLTFGQPGSSFVRLTIFSMNIKNTILTRRIMDDVFEKINGGSTLHRGIEMEYKWTNPSEKMAIEGAYTFGANTFDQFIDGETDLSGNQLPGTPDHRSFLRFTITPLKKLSFHADHHWISKVFLNDANTFSDDGYQLLHTGISYGVDAGKKWKMSLSAKVHNILNVDYSSMYQINAPGAQPRYYYPGKPRSFYLNLVFHHDLGRL